MLCPECGKENKDEANLCVQCGATLGKQESPAPKKSSRGKSWKLYAIGFGFVIVAAIFMLIIICASVANIEPSVETKDATDMIANGATLNGDLTGLGYNKGRSVSVDVSFQWGTSSGSYTNETTVVARTTKGEFSIDITGLDQDTTYYFRAKAVGEGTRYGVEKSFTTP